MLLIDIFFIVCYPIMPIGSVKLDLVNNNSLRISQNNQQTQMHRHYHVCVSVSTYLYPRDVS
jgi:hypothetical protein